MRVLRDGPEERTRGEGLPAERLDGGRRLRRREGRDSGVGREVVRGWQARAWIADAVQAKVNHEPCKKDETALAAAF